ncbi:MAG: Molybdopterin biosynthesis MoeB protein [Frankiales bacterium]|nr:Molybdopterin biosynthesis MoeB protein [Frankiales bacterium]
MGATPDHQEPDRRPWHETCPARLVWEQAQFDDRALAHETIVRDDGTLTIHTTLTAAGATHEIRVEFPFDYPDIEPTIYGPPLLVRHQNQRAGNFCLMGNPSADWTTDRCAAALVNENLKWLLDDTAAGDDAVRAGEADMPEPLSMTIATSGSGVFLVPAPLWAEELPTSGGKVTFAKGRGDCLVVTSASGLPAPDPAPLRTVVAEPADEMSGDWVALPDGALAPWPSDSQVLAAALEANPDILHRARRTLKKTQGLPDAKTFIGVTFMEEGPTVGARRRGWVFMSVQLTRADRANPTVLAMWHAQAFTDAERGLRLPELAGLGDTTVTVVGAGSVGGPLIMELSKAGVGRIGVLDDDTYDVNNATRHVLGVDHAGESKAAAVAAAAQLLNPFITVTNVNIKVGDGGRDGANALDRLIAKSTVVVDATGSASVGRILARRCREQQVTMVTVGLTAGSYGADVATLPANGPCFWCLQLGQADGTIIQPPHGPTARTTPTGCATPAFSGAGFDASALAALAARRVVQATAATSYPPAPSPLTVVDFRGEPAQQHVDVQIHPDCQLCH